MKTKIKEALKQQYPKLGLGDEVFEGVASSAATFVTDETLDAFIKGAEPMLKQFQSIADTARSKKVTELEAKVKELEEKAKKTEGDDKPKDEPKDEPKDNIQDIIKQAVEAAVNPLNAKIESLESANLSKESVATAREAFFGSDYAKKFKDDAGDAWDRTIELYEATGKKLSADELKAKAEGYFNKAVSRRGVDTSKPLEADKHVDDIPSFEDEAKMLEGEGLLKKEEN